jgi:peptide subunit release factor RF-3
MAGTCEYRNEISCFGDWMELAQDRDRWRAIVSTVMKFRVVGPGWSWLRIASDGGDLSMR